MTSPCPTVLIIGGLPCSGKSTMAEAFKRRLGWPLLAKDAFKEILFDELGWRDREWSRQLSGASYALMFALAKELLASGSSFILEGNFRVASHGERLAELLKNNAPRCVQVLCKAHGPVLLERFAHRANAGARHPGHVDLQSLHELRSELLGAQAERLPLLGETFEFDTSSADMEEQRAFVAQVVHAARL